MPARDRPPKSGAGGNNGRSAQLHLPLTHAELGPQSVFSVHGEPLVFA
jgi:hypothetical protein